MPADTPYGPVSERQRKIASVLHRELTSIVQFKLADPRIAPITIVEVVVSRDLKFAKVYATSSANESLDASMECLNRAKGYIRSLLSSKVSLRHTPDLHFYPDRILERANRVLSLIDHVSESFER